MKTYLLIILMISTFNVINGQITINPTEKVPTGYLYDLSPQLAEIEKYNGTPESPVINSKLWNQIYFEIEKSAVADAGLENFKAVQKRAKMAMRADVIPIGLLIFDYNTIDGNPSDFLDVDNPELSEATISDNRVYAAAAFRDEIFSGNNLSFLFSEDFMYSNLENAPTNFQIYFDDGAGWREFVIGDEINVSYQTKGEKIVTMKYTTEKGDAFSRFRINIHRLEVPAPSATWQVEADLGYNNVTTSGDAFILLSDQNAQLANPVVVCEGIDFEDMFGWAELYDLFNQQNMLENLRAEGLDIVILNFHQPLTYIQSNAFLFQKLIEMVNDSIDYAQPIQIVGPSMGGLVTRYALLNMEGQNIDHNCNLWISFEAPNNGANIPLGIQYAVFFFKDLDANVQLLLDVLDGPAARQMLAYHYTDPLSSPATHDPMFDVLQDDYAALGNYPQNLRKISMSNGRADAVGQPFDAGDQAIDFEYESFIVDIKGNMWAVPDNAEGLIFEGLIDPLIGATEQLNASVFSPAPYDNCPGGSRATFAEMGELELPFGEIVVLLENHCFIPTVSTFDLATDDLFYNIENDPNHMDLTPFDEIFWTVENYAHTFISPESATFAIDKILSAQPVVHEIFLSAGWNDLSSYVDPTNKNIQSIASQLGDDLIILQHFGEVYWPGGGISTLESWDYKKGYITKVMADHTLTITGEYPASKNIPIQMGWNLIPVLCKACPTVATLLGENTDKVLIVREAVGMNIFWPAMGIYSLTRLEPGNSYYLYANEPFMLVFE